MHSRTVLGSISSNDLPSPPEEWINKRKPKPKPRTRIYNLKQLFIQTKPRKDFFDQKRTTNILNKLFNTFSKDEIIHLGELFKEEKVHNNTTIDDYDLDILFDEND